MDWEVIHITRGQFFITFRPSFPLVDCRGIFANTPPPPPITPPLYPSGHILWKYRYFSIFFADSGERVSTWILSWAPQPPRGFLPYPPPKLSTWYIDIPWSKICLTPVNIKYLSSWFKKIICLIQISDFLKLIKRVDLIIIYYEQ